MPGRKVRTTVALPAELLQAADQAVREGKVKSRNELLTSALRHELEALERAIIYADFAEMAEDQEYQKVSRQLAEEFAISDWEAFRSVSSLGEAR